MATDIRIVEWNISGCESVQQQMELLDNLGWDIALLQEVRPKHFSDFGLHRTVWCSEYALNHRPDRLNDTESCAAILCRGNIELVEAATMANASTPERTLIGLFRVDGRLVEVVSSSEPERIVDRWSTRCFPSVVGIDQGDSGVDLRDVCRTAICASPEIEVMDVRYHLEDAVETGANDGLVWARVRLRERALALAS